MTSPSNAKNAGRLIWYAVLAAVVLAGIVAIIAAKGTDGDGDTAAAVGPQVAPVAVEAGTEALPEFTEAASDPAVGMEVPAVSGTTLEGSPLSIGPDGGAKVVMFVAHWCPHCQREIPVITEHLRDNPMPDDVELLTVSTAVAEERGNYPPERWLEEAGWPAPVLADSSDSAAAAAYGLSSFPYFVAVDADGKVVARTSGELSTDQFDALVTAASDGRSQ